MQTHGENKWSYAPAQMQCMSHSTTEGWICFIVRKHVFINQIFSFSFILSSKENASSIHSALDESGKLTSHTHTRTGKLTEIFFHL